MDILLRDAVVTATTPSPSVIRLADHLGVQVDGLDLHAGVTAEVVDLLGGLVAEHLVVVLRDQFLDADEHAALAQAFGPIQPSPLQLATGAVDAGGSVTTIEDNAARPPAGFPWHSDLSWLREPPALGFLSAVVIPPSGGDTIWTSNRALLDALTPEHRQSCERSTVWHEPDASLLASLERHHGAAVAERLRREHPGAEHPLVGRHRSSGRRHLFLSPLSATRIVGPAGADGALLGELHALLDDPAFQLRWRWRAGDLVIWDEASTCHRALTDHHPQRRVMRRCTTAGPGRGATVAAVASR
ncbi:MAG: TauD/TfdA family dioxygenase [Ilumatobacteraceae bacterium]